MSAVAVAAPDAAPPTSGAPYRWRVLTGARASRRAVVAVAVVVACTLVAAVLSLTLGTLGIPLVELPGVLAGNGSPSQELVLGTLRLPRLGVALGAGAAFGAAGAIFQSVTRNPLGSPDVIGLGAGAAAGAAAAALVWPGVVPVGVGALIGAVTATAVVYLVSGRGSVAPYRMVVIGIGVAAMATAFEQYALSRARREDAQAVSAWLYGSLDGKGVDDVVTIAVVLAVLLPLTLGVARGLRQLEMGDDAATGLGVRPGWTRLGAVAIGVGLTTGAVAVCGPVAFVALAAPQVARRVTRSAGPGIALGALMGAALLVVSDLLAQHLPWPVRLPVGVVTGGLGGIYLAWLLVREWRRGSV